jgi:large subunit ribosomal protein L10
MKTRAQKQAIVSDLASAIKGSVSSVFLTFKGFTVADEYAMRRELTAQGVKYYITRKSLMKRAAKDAGISGDLPELKESVAVAHLTTDNDDLTLAPRLLYGYVTKFKDKLKMVAGIIDGKFVSGEEITQIATIPPVPVLRGMFVNVINSPIQGFVVALSKIAEKK